MRRKREKKRRPPFGIPKGIALLATPQGWRHSVLTAEGVLLCGRLLDVPATAGPGEAQQAAAIMVKGLAHDFHNVQVDVTWDPPGEPGGWSAQVTISSTSANASG
ncbi:hypothetical protein ACF065_22425 [Streptomyces sp. NPDC015232]|uniref:hypothetical protein n=1 Tax=unclassified Streptomyces TaxID=2593676 RepID=UPI0037003796